MQKQLALITGASSGIGLELAKLFAKDGHDLILVARNGEALQKLANELQSAHPGVKAYVFTSDLSKRFSPQELHEATRVAGLKPSILVNNAGYGSYGSFLTTDLNFELDMLTLNISALTALTKLYVKNMVDAGMAGHVLNLGSTASFVPGPGMAAYFASKHYVLALGDALVQELKPYNIKVTTLCPGPTATNFADASKSSESGLFKKKLPTAAQVALVGYKAMWKGRSVVIPGFFNLASSFGSRFFPRSWNAKIAAMLMNS